MRVLLDTQIWIYLHPKSPSKMSQAEKDLHVRARILSQELTDDEAEIVVPTLCIGEYLVGCDASTWISVVREFSERFVCPDYDLPSAQLAAKVRQAFSAQMKGKIYKDRRNVLSADVKILGAALAHRVKRIYSCDADFRKLASNFIEAFDLPKTSKDLFLEKEIRASLE